jgi:hypothetical protein
MRHYVTLETPIPTVKLGKFFFIRKQDAVQAGTIVRIRFILERERERERERQSSIPY